MMPYNLRNESIVILPKYNFIKYVKYSILYDGAALWNALDKKIANAQSVADFKTMMQTWGGITFPPNYPWVDKNRIKVPLGRQFFLKQTSA